MEETLQKIQQIIMKLHCFTAEEVTSETSLKDLGIDSIDKMDIMWHIEEEYYIDIPTADYKELNTVAQICEYVDQRKKVNPVTNF